MKNNYTAYYWQRNNWQFIVNSILDDGFWLLTDKKEIFNWDKENFYDFNFLAWQKWLPEDIYQTLIRYPLEYRIKIITLLVPYTLLIRVKNKVLYPYKLDWVETIELENKFKLTGLLKVISLYDFYFGHYIAFK